MVKKGKDINGFRLNPHQGFQQTRLPVGDNELDTLTVKPTALQTARSYRCLGVDKKLAIAVKSPSSWRPSMTVLIHLFTTEPIFDRIASSRFPTG